jgi:hypothetical protein
MPLTQPLVDPDHVPLPNLLKVPEHYHSYSDLGGPCMRMIPLPNCWSPQSIIPMPNLSVIPEHDPFAQSVGGL